MLRAARTILAMLKTIEWTGQTCRLLDQTKLPTETCYVDITDEKQMWDAIRRLVVRGAPAIGVAAAFGVYLGATAPPVPPVPSPAESSTSSAAAPSAGEGTGGTLMSFYTRLNEVCDYLAT